MTRLSGYLLAIVLGDLALPVAAGARPRATSAREPPLAAIVAACADATHAVLAGRVVATWSFRGFCRRHRSCGRPGRPPHRVRLDARWERGDLRRGHAHGRGRRLTHTSGAADRRPAWSPGGRRIVWESGQPGAADLHVMRADGTRKAVLVGGPGDDADPAWSPDGARIAFSSNRGGAAPALGGCGDRWRARASCGGSGSSPLARLVAGRTAPRLHARVGRRLRCAGCSSFPTEARASSREVPAATRGPTGRRPVRTSRSRAQRQAAPPSGSLVPKERRPAGRSRGPTA